MCKFNAEWYGIVYGMSAYIVFESKNSVVIRLGVKM